MIYQGDCLTVLKTLPEQSVNCCVTSPPYFGLRDYGAEGQIGREATPDAFVAALVAVCGEVRRVLTKDGVLWLNLGDSYATSGGESVPQSGAEFADRRRGAEVICRSKRMSRGAGRWGGGNAQACGDLKPKDLMGIPWRVAFALQSDGWYLRSDIIWHKPNPMPESVTDRPTKAHEYLFLLTKSARYFYNADAIAEPVSASMAEQLRQGYKGTATKDYAAAGAQDPSAVKARILSRSGNKARKQPGARGCPEGTGKNQCSSVPWEGYTRNKRSVWTIPTQPFPEAHFATFPEALVEPCIRAGCPDDGVVLDPFCGAGTTGVVAAKLNRRFVGIELNPAYITIAEKRIFDAAPLFAAAQGL